MKLLLSARGKVEVQSIREYDGWVRSGTTVSWDDVEYHNSPDRYTPDLHKVLDEFEGKRVHILIFEEEIP